MKHLTMIISGGQTGVDRGALMAVMDAGLAIGGWCPQGRVAEDGRIPDAFPLMETPSDRSMFAPLVPRSLRTEWNVRDSDATLILVPDLLFPADPGTNFTKDCCQNYDKPLLVLGLEAVDGFWALTEWLHRVDPRVLNVAGPSEGTVPGIEARVYGVLCRVLGEARKKFA